ncbi:ATP-binding protein [Chelativorans sp. AA-79]|uniref:sensor histidine kinase n=1 Tax=Chelativorans sp. AA-79 TaxID=3028735 RepID=UPI0023F6C2C4|nr:ATP-binding protein [Chelativorans sp. AA-79]WEX08576.1 ATP-binding protein [Chelativorans sp. AA-79]
MQELQAELVHISRLTAIGELASSLAHELNQPLAAIGNYLSGARRLLSKPSAGNVILLESAIGEATDQALRAGDIIRRLRKFVSRGRSERKVCSLSKIMEDAGALALIGAREQGAAICFNLDAAADRVFADRVQVQQVLINLIRNAIEAMETSERKELIVSSRAKGDGWLEISVSDTGPGLAGEVADRLFQSFVTSKPAGIGVGLSICRTIVESHRGKIWAESPPEGGCVFRFTLPQVREDA